MNIYRGNEVVANVHNSPDYSLCDRWKINVSGGSDRVARGNEPRDSDDDTAVIGEPTRWGVSNDHRWERECGCNRGNTVNSYQNV